MTANNKAIAAAILKRVREVSSSSSSSDDEDITHNITKKVVKKARVENYAEVVVNLYSDIDFKSHFRLNRSTLIFLLDLIGFDLTRKIAGNVQVDPDKQLLIAIWRMANTESYRSIGDRFNVSKSTAFTCVRRVTSSLVNRRSLFIKWPTQSQAITISQHFEIMSGFPDCIGTIDGTHIEIEAPQNVAAEFINRKNYASMQLQVVCDHRYNFTSVFTGFPGRVHDQRIFRNSPVAQYLEDNNKFPNSTHILGDPAFAIHPRLLVPYKDNGHLSVRQKNFNFVLSSARCTVERSFALLKNRWRGLLHCLPMRDIKNMPANIMACCVLHNICIQHSDIISVDAPPDVSGVIPPDTPRNTDHQYSRRLREGQEKRAHLTNVIPLRLS